MTDMLEERTTAPDTAEELRRAQDKIANLERALQTSRVIGMAIGIVIERCRVSADDAFALLVGISQQQNRKLNEVARELVFTGALPDRT